MKNKKRLRRISAFLAALAVFCIYAFNCVNSYAESWTYSVTFSNWYGSNVQIHRCALGSSTWYSYGVYNSTNPYSLSFDFSSYLYCCVSTWSAGSVYRYYSYTYVQNGSTVVFSPGSYYSTLAEARNNSVFTFENPDPTPTPTPAPTATPEPSTPVPVDYNDTQFWNNMTSQANGVWNTLISIFNGIFNNTVMRNLAIYVPLFFLIIGLIVYAFTMGGGDN